MFESLSNRLQEAFKRLRGHGSLTEAELDEALKEIRLALLEADVNYRVVKDFVDRVRTKAVGAEILKSLTPGQQVVKVVRDELSELLGHHSEGLRFASTPPTVILMVGLQGSGKTTTSGKLARWLAREKHAPLLVPADLRRPAAVEQLHKVAAAVGVPTIQVEGETDPVKLAQKGLGVARARGYDVVVVDTAGRLHIDEELMVELERMKALLVPSEILLVTDAMTGQDAVKSAAEFNHRLGLTGIILTKLDGDARGGAALSVRAVTGRPIKFIGVGEKYDALEAFHPDRMASRILGMGDVLTLIERAEGMVDLESAEALETQLRRNSFTLEDFRLQLKQIRRLGPLDQLLELIPGMGRLKTAGVELDPKEMGRLEAILSSMSLAERADHTLLNGNRRRRIARGSGTDVAAVNRLIKQFVEARTMMKRMGKGGLKGLKAMSRAGGRRGR